MAKQKVKASKMELNRYLGSSGAVLDTLEAYINNYENPVWLALAGLSPVTDEEIQELVDAGEMTEEEANAFTQTQAEGQELAEKLRPLVWSKGGKPNKRAILTAYALCQTTCLNQVSGPIGTGDLGTIRQRWYFSKVVEAMGFKFASQALEQYLIRSADVVLVDDMNSYNRARKAKGLPPRSTPQPGDNIMFKSDYTKTNVNEFESVFGRKPRTHVWPKQGWGRAYAQLQSQILSGLVRDGLTYEQLWVRDASRDIDRNDPLVPGFCGAVLLEKQGLFEHFQGFCRAAGIPVLVAMSGNNAFSSVEATINDSFRNWDGSLKVTPDNPLHLFVISDHDYYGHVPVQDGAAGQFAHYLPGMVTTHRVGITPDQLREQGRSPAQAGYEFDYQYNAATEEWAETDGVWVGDTCYAIEVEALEPAAFIQALIDALIEALGGDEALRERLALMAEPDWWRIKNQINGNLAQLSELYRRLKALEEWAKTEQYTDVERPVDTWSSAILDDTSDDGWRNQAEVVQAIEEEITGQRDSVDFDDFIDHVTGKGWNVWRPVSSEAATSAVVTVFEDHHESERTDFAEGIDDDHYNLLDDLHDIFETLAYYGLEYDE